MEKIKKNLSEKNPTFGIDLGPACERVGVEESSSK